MTRQQSPEELGILHIEMAYKKGWKISISVMRSRFNHQIVYGVMSVVNVSGGSDRNSKRHMCVAERSKPLREQCGAAQCVRYQR